MSNISESKVNYRNQDGSFLLAQKKRIGQYDMTSHHFHDSYEIYYLLSGERYYFIKDRTFHVKKNDLVLINAMVLHKTTDGGSDEHERLVINFRKDFVAPSDNNAYDGLFVPFDCDCRVIRFANAGQNIAEATIFKMVREILGQRSGYEIYLKALLMELLITLGRSMDQSFIDPYEHPSPVHKKVSEIVQYINKNYTSSLTLSSVSEQFYISPFYLTRIFKEVTGFTFVEYLNSVRIREAQALLSNSDWKVTRITEEVGFGSIAHFGRVFKDVTGFSPMRYRKINRI